MKVKSNDSTTVIETKEERLDDQKVSITITADLLKVLRRERIDIDNLFILIALYNDYIRLLDIYDDNSQTLKILITDYQLLEFHGFLIESNSDKLYELTQKGKDFVEEILPLITPTEEEKINETEFKQLCSDYLLLFPKIKLPSQKYARTNIVEIEKKMRTWIKIYKPVFKKDGIKITSQDILDATKNYVTRYAKDNYRFMVTSSYFIQKNEKSALADEIQAMKDGLNATPKSNIVTM